MPRSAGPPEQHRRDRLVIAQAAELELEIANGILGYYTPIGEGIFLDLEGRFGYNITQNQFSKVKDDSTDYDIKSNYDIAFYVCVGFRAAASDY